MSGPFIAFYPSDWLAGTRGLSAAETGVYITLIAMMYEREAPLDRDETRLARLCGIPAPGFSRALSVLIDEGKILVTDAGLWNARVELECKKREEKQVSARQSAKARWAKKDSENNDSADANAMRTQCERNANHNQIQKEEEKREDPTDLLVPQAARTTRFDDFWNAYPHRDGRKKNRAGAIKSFTRAVKSGTPDHVIIAGAKRAHSDGEVQRGYARDPTTWLNQRGWEDQTAPASNNLQPMRIANGNQSHHHADAAIDRAIDDLRAGRIDSIVAGPFAPGASRRR